ncbi:MAG: STAS domain-containing protein [bacterium]|nr:STAS domain-containing protein [bacterium]
MQDNVFILSLSGEININSLTETRNQVEESGVECQERVVIDLEKVSFFDSSGLGYLIVLIKQIRMNRGLVALCNPNNLVRRLLSTIRIERYIGIYDSLDEAIELGLQPG